MDERWSGETRVWDSREAMLEHQLQQARVRLVQAGDLLEWALKSLSGTPIGDDIQQYLYGHVYEPSEERDADSASVQQEGT